MPTYPILDHLKANGGFTLDRKGRFVVQNFGYQVSERDLTMISVKELTNESLGAFIALCLSDLRPTENNVGVWLDDNIVYIDTSNTYLDYNEAIDVAVENRQKAIYDWANNKSIYLDWNGGDV